MRALYILFVFTFVIPSVSWAQSPPEINVPAFELPKDVQKMLSKRKSTLTKAHLKTIDEAEKEFLNLYKAFDEKYPPYPKDNAMKISGDTAPNIPLAESQENSRSYSKKCKAFNSSTTGSSCNMGEVGVMELWGSSYGENKANKYSFPEISAEDMVTISGSWASRNGDVITITPKKSPKGRDQFAPHESQINAAFETLDEAIYEAASHAISKAFQKKGWFSKPMPSSEELQDRLKTIKEQYAEPFHHKHSDLQTTGGGSSPMEGYHFQPFPGDLMQYVKKTDAAIAVSITHNINGVNIEYEEAWFNGYNTIAHGKIKKEYLANDGFQPETQAALIGLDFWLICDGFRLEFHKMSDFKQQTHRISCIVWVPQVHESIYNDRVKKQKRTIAEIMPVYAKAATFYLHKTDQDPKNITLTESALGAPDDDLP